MPCVGEDARRGKSRPARPVDDDVLDPPPRRSDDLAPGLRGLGRPDDDDPVAQLDLLVAAGHDDRVAADDARDLRVGRDLGLTQRHADHALAPVDVELDDLHLPVGEDVGLPRSRHADQS